MWAGNPSKDNSIVLKLSKDKFRNSKKLSMFNFDPKRILRPGSWKLPGTCFMKECWLKVKCLLNYLSQIYSDLPMNVQILYSILKKSLEVLWKYSVWNCSFTNSWYTLILWVLQIVNGSQSPSAYSCYHF